MAGSGDSFSRSDLSQVNKDVSKSIVRINTFLGVLGVIRRVIRKLIITKDLDII